MRETARFRWLAPLLLVLLCGCGDDAGGDPATEEAGVRIREARLGPVQAEVWLYPESLRFGDRARLRLVLRHGAGVTMEDLPPLHRLGHFRVRDRRGPDPHDGGVRYRFEVEPERSGPNLLRWPPLAFVVAEGEGAGVRHELRIEPLEIPVAGLAPGETPDLKALGAALPPVPLPAPPAEPWWPWALAALGALAAGAALFRWSRRERPPRPVVIDPAEEARRALEDLLARGLLEQGRYGDFYLELTAIVRRYVERAFGIHAPELTTEEFLREAEGSDRIPPEDARRLGAFLEASDLVKFAAQVPTADEVQASVSAAWGFCGLAPAHREAA